MIVTVIMPYKQQLYLDECSVLGYTSNDGTLTAYLVYKFFANKTYLATVSILTCVCVWLCIHVYSNLCCVVFPWSLTPMRLTALLASPHPCCLLTHPFETAEPSSPCCLLTHPFETAVPASPLVPASTLKDFLAWLTSERTMVGQMYDGTKACCSTGMHASTY
jgi:hypothetical protein